MTEISATTKVLYDYLPIISHEFAKHAVTTMNNGLMNYMRLTNNTIPRDTSNMANTVTLKRATIGVYEASATYNAEYAVYVHGGTEHQQAQPWAQNAVDVMMPDYIARMMAIRLPQGS